MVPTDSAERVERLVALHAQLTTAVETREQRRVAAMLQVAARLPTYSPSNVLLITVQRPDATRVAGFRTWKSLGRSVQRGEGHRDPRALPLPEGRDHPRCPAREGPGHARARGGAARVAGVPHRLRL
jgi:hypothetical protein